MNQHRPAWIAPDLDEVALAARLRAVLGPLSRELRQQSSEPLTATQVSVLASIYRHGPMPLGELASRERLSPPRISKVVDSLEVAGFVERTRDQADRRSGSSRPLLQLLGGSSRGGRCAMHGLPSISPGWTTPT
jgi:DNA-binding transcriptional ArsR family regulator